MIFLRWSKGDEISNIQKVKSSENFVGLFEHPLYTFGTKLKKKTF